MKIDIAVLRINLKSILVILGIFFSISIPSLHAAENLTVDSMLDKSFEYLNTDPERAKNILEDLERQKIKFTEKQQSRFNFSLSGLLGFQGKHRERVEFIRSIISEVVDPELKVKFFYQLSDSYTVLGEYENALHVMNEEIILLPKLSSLGAKISTLQAAINLLNSLGAYEESINFANRMLLFDDGSENGLSRCYGLGNQIEVNFLKKDSQFVQRNLKQAIKVCDAANRSVISLIIKSIGAVDLINSGNIDYGITLGLPLLKELMLSAKGSEYAIRLEEALARAYLLKKNLFTAEQYGFNAYQKSKNENIVQLQENASETMAIIKQAQGQFVTATEYYRINNDLKKKILSDQLHKNLAYQRVKFDIQDKANQLVLLEQKNRVLLVEKQLELRKNENLVLLITLGSVLLAVISGWLITTWRQKNIFRKTS